MLSDLLSARQRVRGVLARPWGPRGPPVGEPMQRCDAVCGRWARIPGPGLLMRSAGVRSGHGASRVRWWDERRRARKQARANAAGCRHGFTWCHELQNDLGMS